MTCLFNVFHLVFILAASGVGLAFSSKPPPPVSTPEPPVQQQPPALTATQPSAKKPDRPQNKKVSVFCTSQIIGKYSKWEFLLYYCAKNQKSWISEIILYLICD